MESSATAPAEDLLEIPQGDSSTEPPMAGFQHSILKAYSHLIDRSLNETALPAHIADGTKSATYELVSQYEDIDAHRNEVCRNGNIRSLSPIPDCGTFASEDLPLYAPGLCLSPPALSLCSSSPVRSFRSCSFANFSTTTTKSGLKNSRSGQSPCLCPFIQAHQIIEAAKNCAFAHFRAYAPINTFPDGQKLPMVQPWMHEHIDKNLDQAYKVCVSEIKEVTEVARPNGWPMHDNKSPLEQYPGHVQPWMRALAHRSVLLAANAAFAVIDKRQGISDDARPPFQFDFPGILCSNMMRYPCQCKESHAMHVSFRVLEETMTRLDPFISTLAACSPNTDRVATYFEVWNDMKGHIQRAMLNGLATVAEPADSGHLCSEIGMPHVQPWMTNVIVQNCQSVARLRSKSLRWRVRDVHIAWFQDWLEMLYRQDAADDSMGDG